MTLHQRQEMASIRNSDIKKPIKLLLSQLTDCSKAAVNQLIFYFPR